MEPFPGDKVEKNNKIKRSLSTKHSKAILFGTIE